jgi:hypothetical protein
MDYISKMLGITPRIAICQCQVEGPTVCIQILGNRCGTNRYFDGYEQVLLLDCTTREECGSKPTYKCCA